MDFIDTFKHKLLLKMLLIMNLMVIIAIDDYRYSHLVVVIDESDMIVLLSFYANAHTHIVEHTRDDTHTLIRMHTCTHFYTHTLLLTYSHTHF